ncbi:hypothetical protein D3C72_2120450 [compost metagenome]
MRAGQHDSAAASRSGQTAVDVADTVGVGFKPAVFDSPQQELLGFAPLRRIQQPGYTLPWSAERRQLLQKLHHLVSRLADVRCLRAAHKAGCPSPVLIHSPLWAERTPSSSV